MIPLLFFSLISSAQNSNWVDRKQVDEVRKALDVYYSDCGHYPDTLETLLEPVKRPLCLKEGEPPLANNNTNRDTISKLIYTPFGYQDYELSMRLFSTRPE